MGYALFLCRFQDDHHSFSLHIPVLYGDTAVNAGILALLQSNTYLKRLPEFVETVFTSLAAVGLRMILIPVEVNFENKYDSMSTAAGIYLLLYKPAILIINQVDSQFDESDNSLSTFVLSDLPLSHLPFLILHSLVSLILPYSPSSVSPTAPSHLPYIAVLSTPHTCGYAQGEL
jgi:hypothetical protein